MKNIKNIKNYMLFAILILLSSALSSFAMPSKLVENGIYVVDETNTLSAEEIDTLNGYAQKFSDALGVNIVYIESENCDGMDTIEYTTQLFENYQQEVYEAGIYNKNNVIFVFNVEANEHYHYVSDEISDFMTQDYIKGIYAEMEESTNVLFDFIDTYQLLIAADYDFEYNNGEFFAKFLATDTNTNTNINANSNANETASVRKKVRLVKDGAELISYSAEKKLLEKAQSLSEKYNMDIMIETVQSLEGRDIDNFVETLYKELDYGQGSNKDGMLFLICPEERDYALYKKGKPYHALMEYNKYWENVILDEVLSYLKDDRYEEGFNAYLDKTDKVFSKLDEKGKLPKPKTNPLLYLGGILGGFLISLIVVSIGKSSLKSVRFNRTANSYMKENSMNLTSSRDEFLYRNVVRKVKPKKESSSSGGGRDSGSSSGRY